MRRLITVILSTAILTAMAMPALAQADAQQAYSQAKTAYEAGEFAEARDLAQTASRTDTKNPEVFLLLGKAHYQLGELDEAVAAWRRTLALAPEEPFAKRMLDALRSEQTDVEVRIKLVEAMLVEKLYAPAAQECSRLLADKALSDAQRAKVMTLQAEVAVRTGGNEQAQKVLREILVLYPRQADPAQTTLLLGQAKVRAGGEAAAEGLALLKKVVAEHAGTPAAAAARLELISFELKQGADATRAGALAQWLADSPTHPMVAEALRSLMDAYLAVTLQGPKPTAQSELSPSDVKALALAVELYKQSVKADDAKKLTEQLLAHVESHYANSAAFAAAVQGVESLLAAPLPRSSRLLALKAQARYKTSIALKQLDEQAASGKLPQGVPRGQLPGALAEVAAIYDTITKEYPAHPVWADRAELAKQVRSYAAKVLAEAVFRGLKGPDAWALDVAMPVIQADADAAAVKSAVETVQGIVHDRTQVPKPGSRRLAVELSRELVEALAPTHAAWTGVMRVHAEILDGYAKYEFEENIKAGKADRNAQLSDVQEELLATLQKHVAREAGHAPAAMEQLGKHLQLWIENRHWAVAEEAYAALATALPETQQRRAELAIVRTWIRQATGEQQRLLAAGLTVPRELDPTLTKALTRCYELQAGLDDEPSILAEVRGVSNSIVDHYKGLEYDDVAEAAIRVKADEAVALADQYAASQLVQLKDEHARRELSRWLRQYGASEKIALTPEFQAAIDGWTQFIADHPTSSLVPQAVEKVFAIGQVFEGQGAYSVAATVYGEFAKFAAGVAVLSQPTPGKLNTTQRAALAAATSLDAEARKALAKARADRQPDDPPPAEISKEFAGAIAAYYGLIEAFPESPAVSRATEKIMAIAYEYAKIDAWDVADGVYAGLLESDLEIRRVERLKFARGLCQLGRAMPDHAREVLAALTTGGLRGSGEAAGPEMLAVLRDGGAVVRGDMDESGGAVGGGLAGADRLASPTEPTPEPAVTLPAQPPAGTTVPGDSAAAQRDSQLLAMIRRQESNRAAQVAQLRERIVLNAPARQGFAMQQTEQQAGQQAAQGQQAVPVPVLSEAELTRQQKAIDAAYAIFQAIRKEHPHTPTALQARAEVLVMVGHWRTLTEWERSAALAGKFLADNPTDGELPKLRLEIARDRLAWASKPLPGKATKQERLDEVSKRFDAARAELTEIVADFPKQRSYQQQAQWDIAGSYLKQARVVGAFSAVLARGQFVRTAKELTQVAEKYPKHPQIGSIPQMLWNVSTELEGRAFNEEAILVWNELILYDPMNNLSQQAALKIAQTYHHKLQRPLKAAEAYQELNFARGGSDQELQNAIFQIGSDLKNEKRWVEALHVLETFVDSFPRHGQAGQALTMVGQIHQANEAWEDAIAAYRRVIAEFKNGQFVQDAKWAIAECTINLSQWPEAMAAYRDYVKTYGDDSKVAEANRRIEVLKDLVRYQGLVDEQGQRKAFDAQYQIAEIVKNQLSNPVKAIIEYRKVVKTWPESHLADDALYAVGTTYLSLGETEKAREALLEVGKKYPASPLADDAVFMVGKSYEEEADRLATATREKTIQQAKQVAQRWAYEKAQAGRRLNFKARGAKIASLKAAGKGKLAELEEAATASQYGQFTVANTELFAQKAEQDVETLTAMQLADREDKINAALRKAVEAYTSTSKVAGADKADEALLQMATIYDQRLKDSKAAMETWLEIVRQFSGTAVAEDASWRIAEYHEREKKYAGAIEAYKSFLRNYRRSPKAGAAQFAIAETYEHLGQWVSAMDSYSNYITNFPEGALAQKAKDQINWIKTYRL